MIVTGVVFVSMVLVAVTMTSLALTAESIDAPRDALDMVAAYLTTLAIATLDGPGLAVMIKLVPETALELEFAETVCACVLKARPGSTVLFHCAPTAATVMESAPWDFANARLDFLERTVVREFAHESVQDTVSASMERLVSAILDMKVLTVARGCVYLTAPPKESAMMVFVFVTLVGTVLVARNERVQMTAMAMESARTERALALQDGEGLTAVREIIRRPFTALCIALMTAQTSARQSMKAVASQKEENAISVARDDASQRARTTTKNRSTLTPHSWQLLRLPSLRDDRYQQLKNLKSLRRMLPAKCNSPTHKENLKK